ncbi:Transcriptional regulatory protein TdiR [Pirellula sp. SH-Sr6A]|nr:Transcriptional regulatory protein TdiR [Pirellula sp. SH-Sr6A]
MSSSLTASTSLQYLDSHSYAASSVPSLENVYMTVYIVDSDPKARGVVKKLADGAGYTVIEFDSAERFLSLIQSEPLGCIVLELELGDTDGTSLIRRIRDAGWKIPILIVTSQNDIGWCASAFNAGASDYLAKPVDPDKLLSCIRNAYDASEKRKQELQAQIDAEKKLSSLTLREREVLELLVAGNSMKTIASSSGTSFQAVARHRQRILEKLGLEGDVALARWVFDLRRGGGKV